MGGSNDLLYTGSFCCPRMAVPWLTWEIPSNSKGKSVFDPQHDAIVLGDGAQQCHGLPSNHHLVLGLLREGRCLTWREGRERGTRLSVCQGWVPKNLQWIKKALAKRCQTFPLIVSFRIATTVLELSWSKDRRAAGSQEPVIFCITRGHRSSALLFPSMHSLKPGCTAENLLQTTATQTCLLLSPLLPGPQCDPLVRVRGFTHIRGWKDAAALLQRCRLLKFQLQSHKTHKAKQPSS